MKKATINLFAMLSVNKIILLVIASYFASPVNAENTDELTYKHAIAQAHNADYPPALASLKILADKYPKPNRYFYDYISILGWAEKHHEIVKHTDSISLQEAPQYVLNTLAIAQRQQLNFTAAEKTYRVINKRFPKFIDGKIGLALVLIDQEKFALAHTVLFSLQQQHPDDLRLLNALIYFYESQHNFMASLRIYQHILEINPTDTDTLRRKLITLNRMGASHLAESLINNPDIFSNEDLARIKTDMSAHQIRWAGIPQNNEKNRFNAVSYTHLTLPTICSV